MIQPIDILLVEDNETDALIAKEALKSVKAINRLNVIDNGEDAIRFLRRERPYESAATPALILLDLNLPRKSGQEVLADIKADATLKLIPVVILTTSQSEDDILRAYRQHANSYVTKPLDFAAFQRILKSLEDYWLCIVKLPPRAQ